jgi:hypothetical protein
MRYQPRKEWKDYEKVCEWLVIKLGLNNPIECDRNLEIKASKENVRALAELLAEEYNKGYSDSIIAMGAMKR